MKALYSSWSRTGSSCSVAAWAWRVIVRNRIRSGSSPSVRVESLRSTRTPRSAIRRASSSATPGQGRAEVHEVGVGVEHGHPQVGLQEEPLEEHAEGVGLARAALAAEEGVPVEPAGPQAGLGADVTRAPGADGHRPGSGTVQATQLGGPGEGQRSVAEGGAVPALHGSLVVEGPDDDPDAGQPSVVGVGDVDDLAEQPRGSGRCDDDHVAGRDTLATRCGQAERAAVPRRRPDAVRWLGHVVSSPRWPRPTGPAARHHVGAVPRRPRVGPWSALLAGRRGPPPAPVRPAGEGRGPGG